MEAVVLLSLVSLHTPHLRPSSATTPDALIRVRSLGSGIPFPIPWSYVLKNMMINLTFVWRFVNNSAVKELTNYRNEHGLPGRPPLIGQSVARSLHTLSFGVPELDFPITLPPNVGLYGPVALDSTPLSKGDELSAWLDNGRTIVMCMGTHFHYSEAQIRNTIRAFLAGTASTDQILWKIRNKAKHQHVIDEELEKENSKERFKLVDWIDADPGEVMKHENVVAYIHHGGANSYYEAARYVVSSCAGPRGSLTVNPPFPRAGIPQIILAQWWDLYDMAIRAEYVGIGIYGNRSVAPGIDATELGSAISRLLSPGEESDKLSRRAKEIGEICRRAPGKKGAVAKILELVEGGGGVES